MGQKPAPEFLLTGRIAWRRRLAVEAPVHAERSIAVSYPDPRAIERALRPMFTVERTETFGVVVPPPGTANWPRRNPIAFGLLALLEAALSRRRGLCRFADHYLIELRRR